MIGLFVRLKLTLIKNMLRGQAGYGYVIFSLLAGFVSVVSTIALWRADQASLVVLGPLIGSVLTVGWVLGPIFYGTSDESLDTTKLALFPIDGGQATRGIAIASLISPGPIATVAPLGVFVIRCPGPLSAAIGLAAAIGSLLLPVAASKLVLTLLGNASRTSGKRDWATTAAGIGAAALAIGMQAIVAYGPGLSIDRLEPLASVLAWTPLGWAGDALGQATAGALLVPTIKVLAIAGLLVAVLRLWSTALEKALTEVVGEQASDLQSSHLLGRSARWNSRFYGPVIAKELRYLRRDPRYRMQIISQLVVLFIGGVPFVQAVIDKNPAAVLIGCIPALTTGVTGTNLLGPDGRALWAETLALDSLQPLIRGRSLAFVTIGFTGAFVVTMATATYTGGWQYAPVALGAAAGMAFLGSGVGSIVSVTSPTPYPESKSPNPFASANPGQGILTALFTITGVLLGLLGAAPILAGLGFSRSSGIAWIATTVLSPVYGVAIWRWTTRYAGRRADERVPEIIGVFAAAT